ncbi:hypothetical protein CUB90_08495 [Clostridium sp. CT7]|nr:hypothetical protein CUB90_08495 [Clostridium sp. CT7]
MLKEQFKKILINLELKIIKYLDIISHIRLMQSLSPADEQSNVNTHKLLMASSHCLRPKFRRHGGIFSLLYLKREVTMLKERFKKILINLELKIIKYLDISICLSFFSASY